MSDRHLAVDDPSTDKLGPPYLSKGVENNRAEKAILKHGPESPAHDSRSLLK